MMGGAGSDTYLVDSVDDVIIEGSEEGIDTVQASASYTLSANAENLILTGDAAINGAGNELNNVLIGNSANNQLAGGAGDDTLQGGAGNDLLDGGDGSDTLIGGTGDDTYVVDSAGDVVTESPDEGADTVQSSVTYTLGTNLENLILTGLSAINGTGNAYNNVLTGNVASNTLTGGQGSDTLDGGEGNDRYVYNLRDGLDRLSDVAGQDTIVLGPGIDFDHTVIRLDATTAHLRLLDIEGNETDQGIDIALSADGTIPVETVSFADGTSFSASSLVIQATTVYGTNKSDFIYTGRHDDTIYALKGNDKVYAGLGNDTILASAGNDSVHGEGGNDTVYAGEGNDNVYGEAGSDTIYGETGNDFIDGGSGADRLYGGDGNDTIFGRTGSDLLDGGEGNDTLMGGDGDEILLGGTGNDTIFGGAGNDVIQGNAGNDLIVGGAGDDTILFNRGDGHDFVADLWDSGNDTVKFGARPIDLVFSKSWEGLNVSINRTCDDLTILGRGWWNDSQVDVFEASDGSRLLNTQVDQLIQAMGSFCSNSGMSWSQAIQQKPAEVQQVLTQYWQPMH